MKKRVSIKLYIILWVLFLLYPLNVFALPSNKIFKTTFQMSPEMETIQIQTKNFPEYNTFDLVNPNRIVINLKNTFLPGVHYSKKTNGFKTNRFRVSQNTKKIVRLVIDLTTKANYKTTITSLKNGSYALNIHISKTPPPVPKNAKISVKDSRIKPVLITWLEPVAPSSMASATTHLDQKNPKSLTLVKEKKEDKILQQEKGLEQNTIVMLNESAYDEDIFDFDEPGEQEKNAWNFSGSTLVRASIDTEKDAPNENKTSFKNRTILKTSYKDKFKLSVLSDFLYFSFDDQTDEYTIDFFETYYKHLTSNFEFSIGKQIKRWGKTDQISPVDTLNPENLTEFFIPSYEERKIPVWMADLVFKKNNFFIEGVFIPFFEPAKFEYFGTDWAYFSHLKSDINDSSLNNSLKSYFNSMSVNENKPNHSTDGFEYAIRVGGTINDIDMSLSYHYALEDLPNFLSFPVKNLSLKNPNSIEDLIDNIGGLTLTNEQIETKYLRTHIFGFEFETIIHDFGLRGEAAYNENESFLTQSFTSVRNPSLFWILGMDYTSLDQWYFNLQFGHQHISNHDSSTLYFDEDNYYLIGEIKKDIFFDWFNGSIQYTYMLNDDSYYLSPRLIYTYIENLEIILGLNYFEGSDVSIFGRYDHNDQIFLDMTYQF